MTEKMHYPTPDERAGIMARRNQLHRALIQYLVTRSPDEQEAREQMNPIVHEYGFDEVHRMLQKISPMLNRPQNPEPEDVYLYNQYMAIYRRFGGDRPLLSPSKYQTLNYERAMLLGKQILQEQQLSGDEQRRLDQLSETLLSEPFLWDDLVPENPPQAAIALPSLQSKKIGRNQPCPCGSGRKYKHCHGR